jgi:hypothetical protein
VEVGIQRGAELGGPGLALVVDVMRGEAEGVHRADHVADREDFDLLGPTIGVSELLADAADVRPEHLVAVAKPRIRKHRVAHHGWDFRATSTHLMCRERLAGRPGRTTN